MIQHGGTESGRGEIRLEAQNALELVSGMQEMDAALPEIMLRSREAIAVLAEAVSQVLKNGGRLFYLGAGTSGRLGILDASECPPTFGVPHDMVIGLIAGGDSAIRKAVEFAEDDTEQGFRDLQQYDVRTGDLVVGISASGRTPYVLGALRACRAKGIQTGCICCNTETLIAREADFPVELATGPEFVTGSTRLKAGTATKMALNILSTGVMVRLGKVHGNRMVDVAVTNVKLEDRALRILRDLADVPKERGQTLLAATAGSVKLALLMELGGLEASQAREHLASHGPSLRTALVQLAQDPQ